ncbi:DNA-directed RNA polymerase specialized sigma subunit, sigma24 family [Nonomuraea pusilla]|uniref:DNA-directed RNA polymerase specialized sigma subunit, sigma24 family n=2 Tax=Nonomuraea pusilla TaxID=46177 RepID=A0A1H7QI49_9ACTN|nr:DNA-directed RNA polymerase specialized sigma subunit, sigma24 family [Nonomuraea pusilla]
MSVETPHSDADLLQAVRQGDAAAWGRLHRRHVRAGRALAAQLVGGVPEAEDVTAEAFTRILDLVGRGGGPESAFRAYLLTAVRRTIDTRLHVGPSFHQAPPGLSGGEATARQPGLPVRGHEALHDPGAPLVDPSLAGLEHTLTARAYLLLPERWQAVLWHTVLERAQPPDVAPLFGLPPNGVAALAYRAREGLRQAYVHRHLATGPCLGCRTVLGEMCAYVRGSLPKRDSRAVDEHAATCEECRTVLLDLTDLDSGLHQVVGPLIAGPAYPAYLATLTARPTPEAASGKPTKPPRRSRTHAEDRAGDPSDMSRRAGTGADTTTPPPSQPDNNDPEHQPTPSRLSRLKTLRPRKPAAQPDPTTPHPKPEPPFPAVTARAEPRPDTQANPQPPAIHLHPEPTDVPHLRSHDTPGSPHQNPAATDRNANHPSTPQTPSPFPNPSQPSGWEDPHPDHATSEPPSRHVPSQSVGAAQPYGCDVSSPGPTTDHLLDRPTHHMTEHHRGSSWTNDGTVQHPDPHTPPPGTGVTAQPHWDNTEPSRWDGTTEPSSWDGSTEPSRGDSADEPSGWNGAGAPSWGVASQYGGVDRPYRPYEPSGWEAVPPGYDTNPSPRWDASTGMAGAPHGSAPDVPNRSAPDGPYADPVGHLHGGSADSQPGGSAPEAIGYGWSVGGVGGEERSGDGVSGIGRSAADAGGSVASARGFSGSLGSARGLSGSVGSVASVGESGGSTEGTGGSGRGFPVESAGADTPSGGGAGMPPGGAAGTPPAGAGMPPAGGAGTPPGGGVGMPPGGAEMPPGGAGTPPGGGAGRPPGGAGMPPGGGAGMPPGGGAIPPDSGRRARRYRTVLVGATALAAGVAAAIVLAPGELPVMQPLRGMADEGPAPAHLTSPPPAEEPMRVPAPSRKKKAGKPRLHASIEAVGALVGGRPGIVGMRLRNDGKGPSEELDAVIDLPPGVTPVQQPGTRPQPAAFQSGSGGRSGPAEWASRARPTVGQSDQGEGAASASLAPWARSMSSSPEPGLSGNGAAVQRAASEAVPGGKSRFAHPVAFSAQSGLGGNGGSAQSGLGGDGASARLGLGGNGGSAQSGLGGDKAFVQSGDWRADSGGSVRAAGLGRGVRGLAAGRGVAGAGVPLLEAVGDADGWVCRPVDVGARCGRAALQPGESTAVFLRVVVSAEAPRAAGPSVRVGSGSLRVSARAQEGVRTDGSPARFATEGRVDVRAIGGSLLSCPAASAGCAEARRREGIQRDNDLWPMAAFDGDKVRSTRASSSAVLALPAKGEIVWAGLYWSAAGTSGGSIMVRPPGRSKYVMVQSQQVTGHQLASVPVYQAFADVTAMVSAARKSGTWWVADAPLAEGVGRYAGWSLVVVTTDPGLPYSRAMVLDAATVVGGEAGPARIPLDGLAPAASPARIELVTWEGDADIKDDQVSAGGVALTPLGGDRDPGNVFDGSSNGATEMTPGVDVDTLVAELGDDPALTITTDKDVVLVGVAAVSVRARS